MLLLTNMPMPCKPPMDFMSDITPISELQADCMAGVYLGLIPNVMFDDYDIEEITDFVYDIGDYNWLDKDHYGTPEEKFAAVVRGIRASMDGYGPEACF